MFVPSRLNITALVFFFFALMSVAFPKFGVSQEAKRTDYLSGETVLIIRHAEKPDNGPGLTPEGEARARAYVRYFEPFHEAGERFAVNALFAGSDSATSTRPRLTLEPLAEATHLKIDTSVSSKDPQGLVSLLRTKVHGSHPLVCWRHGQIPTLVEAFGTDPARLFPGGKWPDDVFGWVIVLHFDAQGRVSSAKRVEENLPLR